MHTYSDDLPYREGMRTPHKNRHTVARFTLRGETPARFRHDGRTGR